MKRVRIESDAERDLAEIVAWYEDQRVGLGAAFLARFDATLKGLSRLPRITPTSIA